MSPQPLPGQAQQPDALTPLFQALAQAMAAQAQTGQGRLRLQGQQTFGRHLGIGGAEVTPENPQGHAAGDPFSNGFFNNTASQLSPEARIASQGNNAFNQWGREGELQGVDRRALDQANTATWADHRNPAPYDPVAGAFGASPQPFQISPQSSALVHGYGTPPPSGPQMPNGFQGQPMPGQAKRKGVAFNFMGGGASPMGSPRKGFSFGM